MVSCDDRMTAERDAVGSGGRLSQSGWLIGVLVLSVLVRVGVALYLGDQVPPPVDAPDDTSYSYLAERLLHGYGYSFDRPWYPFGKPADYPTAHWSFLYTAYLAAVYALFGIHPLAARLVSAVIGGVLLPLALYRLARRVFPKRERLSLLTATCAAFYGYFILYSARLLTETFYIIAVSWSLERAIAVAKRPTWARGLSLGISLGTAALLRQSIVPWVAVLFVWLVWSGWHSKCIRATVGATTLAAVVLILAIVPFTVRNYRVYGSFLLLNSNTGYAMYSAQHPMHGTHFDEYAAAPLPEDLRDTGMSEAEMDRELMRRAIGFVLGEPGRYILLSLSRVRDFFVFWPTANSGWLYDLGRMVSFGLFLPFMLWGGWQAWRAQGPLRTVSAWIEFSTTPFALLFLFIVFYSVLHILTWAVQRYRLPADAVALVFVALVLDQRVIPWATRRFGRSKSRGRERVV